MNHSNGIQLPQGLLPSVEVLTPGLVLLFKHQNVDRRYALEHIQDLSDALTSSKLRASFTEIDCSRGSLDDALAQLRTKRDNALRDGRVQFVLSPHFAPRAQALADAADAVFYYMSAMTCALLMATKVDGQQIKVANAKYLEVLNRKPSKHQWDESAHPEEEGITITVTGRHHSGRSAVSAIIHNALQDKWGHIPINWQDPDNNQALVQSNLVEGHYETIDAKSFKIECKNLQVAAKGGVSA